MKEQSSKLQIKDLVTTGIFTAIYFVINLIIMVCGGISPIIWIAMPTIIALLCGVVYLLFVTKVAKTGGILFMGLITSIIYVATGMFTFLMFVTFGIACVIAEVIRKATGYKNITANIISYAFFSLGMVGSPLPIWIFRDSFLQQMANQGMPADYVTALSSITPTWVMFAMVAATFLAALVGGFIGKGLLKKHFVKAGMV